MERNKYKSRFEHFIPKVIVVVILFAAGVWVGQNVALPFGNNPKIINLTNSDTPSYVDVDFAPFWAVWQQVTENHLNSDEIDVQKLLYGAISGMVNAVGDPYSVFLDPDQNSEFLASLAGTFEGVGIELGVRDGKLVVVAPLEGTPAEAAGIRASDVIIGIDGKDATDITIPEAVQKIRGAAGTKVTLTIKRGDGDPFDVEITRGKITVKSVRLTTENNVPVIRLSRFGDNTKSEWDAVVSELLTKNNKKVILDLRNNPGGRLDFAIYVAGEFLRSGEVVTIQEDAARDQQKLQNDRAGRLQNIELIILINEGSASASEIVAGALRDNKGIKLVGMKTFGKGTVQKVEDLADGSGLHITTAKWLTPKGYWVNDGGLVPDVKVDRTEEDFKADKDPQLLKAIELLR